SSACGSWQGSSLRCHDPQALDLRWRRSRAQHLASRTPARDRQSGGDLLEALQNESARRLRPRRRRDCDRGRRSQRHRGDRHGGTAEAEPMNATAFAPGSIGNVGPGFDVLGLAIEGFGDRVTVELTDGDARVDSITGVDGALVPLDPQRNAAAIAAIAWLRVHGDSRNPIVTIDKGLPLSGGLGGSAASSVAGAFAAALAMGSDTSPTELAAAALQ